GGGGGGGEGGGGGGGADGGGGGGGGAAGGGEGGAPRAPSRSCAVSPRGVLSGEGRRAPPWGAPGAPPRGRAAWSGVAREDPGRPGSLAPRKKKNSRRKVCRNVSAPGGPGTGGAGPAARARCGASAGVRSSLGGCTEKHPLCPDGRRPGRDIGSGAASRRPTAWWGPRRRQRWPYSVLTSSPPDLQAKQGCPENPDRRGDSGDREGAAQTARAARELSRAERGDPAKQRQASPVGSRLGSQPAGKGSGPSWSGDRLESLCGPQH
ncbi:unnamed protein product, partial [Prorocentrum cordatum]